MHSLPLFRLPPLLPSPERYFPIAAHSSTLFILRSAHSPRRHFLRLCCFSLAIVLWNFWWPSFSALFVLSRASFFCPLVLGFRSEIFFPAASCTRFGLCSVPDLLVSVFFFFRRSDVLGRRIRPVFLIAFPFFSVSPR